MLTVTLFKIVRNGNNPMSSKKNAVYSYNRIVSHHKKEGSATMSYSRMNFENTTLSEKHQIPRNTHSMIPFNEMSRTGRSTERKSSLAVIRGQG